jgi:hypothetical protein
MRCLQFVIIFGKILIDILLSLLPVCMYSGLNECPPFQVLRLRTSNMSPFTSLNFIIFSKVTLLHSVIHWMILNMYASRFSLLNWGTIIFQSINNFVKSVWKTIRCKKTTQDDFIYVEYGRTSLKKYLMTKNIISKTKQIYWYA